MTRFTDSELYDDLVRLTAEFRYRICWSGTRALFAERQIDPLRCIVLGVDQGDDVNLVLMLPDGRIADTNAREDPETRQSTHFASFDIVSYVNRETELASAVIAGEYPKFDSDVADWYDSHWREIDEPLPSRSELQRRMADRNRDGG